MNSFWHRLEIASNRLDIEFFWNEFEISKLDSTRIVSRSTKTIEFILFLNICKTIVLNLRLKFISIISLLIKYDIRFEFFSYTRFFFNISLNNLNSISFEIILLEFFFNDFYRIKNVFFSRAIDRIIISIFSKNNHRVENIFTIFWLTKIVIFCFLLRQCL